MAERIKRADLVRLVRDYKGGMFDRAYTETFMNFQRLPKVYISNASGSGNDLDVGEAVCISGLANSNSFEKQFSEYSTIGFWLSGVPYDSSNPSRPVAFALEPISGGSIGEVFLPGISAAVISGYSSGKNYAVMEGGVLTAQTDEGDFRIIGVSSAYSGNCFGYVVPHVKGTESGHLIGYISGSSITGPSQTTTVTVCDGTDCGSGSVSGGGGGTYSDVKCPILRSGETIASGTVVVISKNLNSKEWEIIEAQCPEDN